MFYFDGILLSHRFSCIPYIGSKRNLVSKILRVVLSRHPHTAHFYDLFGGGGAMSSCAVTNAPQLQTVHYNDIDPATVSLFTELRDWFFGQHDSFTPWSDSSLPREFYLWRSRDEYNKSQNVPSYLGGLLRAVWSFAQTPAYIYPNDAIPYKHALFHFLIDGSHRDELEHFLGTSFPVLRSLHTVEQRRLHFLRFTTKHAPTLLPHFAPRSLNHIQQIHPLERLKQISQCQAICKLSAITNQPFIEVEIPKRPQTVIYVDPPYTGTGLGAYRFGSETFDYDSFYKWCMDSPFPIYISEYTMPPCFEVVCEFPVSASLAPSGSRTGGRKRLLKIEKLFWNGKY